jgi:hypothetical protein
MDRLLESTSVLGFVVYSRGGVGSPNSSFNFEMPESQAEAFQQEMLAWVNQSKKTQSRSATLV